MTSVSGAVARSAPVVDAAITTVEGHLLNAFSPSARPDLWQLYLDGVHAAYARFEVLAALDLDALADPSSTSLAFVVHDDPNQPVAGLRCHGPLHSATEVAALSEMAESPRIEWFRGHVDGLLCGSRVLETKGTWVAEGARDRRALAACTSRCNLHAIEIFEADHALCTAPRHAQPLYEATGAVVINGAGVAAYPDERYETAAMIWSASGVADAADPAHWSDIVRERDQLRAALVSGRPLPASAADPCLR